MIRFLLRFIGFVLSAAAFAALIVDGTRTVAAHAVMTFSLGETARWLLPTWTAEITQAADHGSAFVAEILVGVLRLPTCLVVGTLAVLFFLAGRRPAHQIGYLDDR